LLRVEHAVGFECSGNNNARGNPLVGNAKWAGTPLAPLLKEAGLKPTAREVVFFSFDKGTEDVTHGRGNAKVAIVSLLAGIGADSATERLERSGGDVRGALR